VHALQGSSHPVPWTAITVHLQIATRIAIAADLITITGMTIVAIGMTMIEMGADVFVLIGEIGTARPMMSAFAITVGGTEVPATSEHLEPGTRQWTARCAIERTYSGAAHARSPTLMGILTLGTI
jgi:hypothetical protein